MLEQSIARDVLDAALATGGDFAEIFLEDRRNNTLILQDNRLEMVNSGRIHGAGIRVYTGLNAVYAYTNDTSREGLLRCAGQAASAVKQQRRSPVQAAPFVVANHPNVHVIQQAPSADRCQERRRISCAPPMRPRAKRRRNRPGGMQL